ncbi:hypothetical protein [Fusobacterium sp. MFO224]|uniref:hypothetical protein n=1 Tax=Fusobacterium sp. MFO224 TaxID=3378070 RepID=UPI00385455C2
MKKDSLFVYDITDKDIIKKSKPKTKDEKTLLKILLETFGEFTTIPEVSKTLKISKTSLYLAKNQRQFVSYLIENRIVILTKTLINFMKTYDDEKNK